MLKYQKMFSWIHNETYFESILADNLQLEHTCVLKAY